jgi:hypothetical protein
MPNRPEISFIYKRWHNNTIFRGVDRLKLIAGIMAARKGDGGCYLKIYDLIKDGCLLSFFPLHDIVELRELEAKWLRFWYNSHIIILIIIHRYILTLRFYAKTI